MESNGEEGNVMVSEATKNILSRDDYINYVFDYHKTVKIDKLGIEIKGFFIFPKFPKQWTFN